MIILSGLFVAQSRMSIVLANPLRASSGADTVTL
jgi:hypothetical protein